MKSRRGGPKSKQIWYLLAAKLIPFLMGIEHSMYIFRSQGAYTIFRKTVFLFVNYPTELSYLLTAVLFDPSVGISSLPL